MPVGPNWEVRNRYIETGSNELGIGAAVTDPNGTGVIEHVYIRSFNSSDKPAIWIDPQQHEGHLIIRNVHIEGHADNAIYGEVAPERMGGSGESGTMLIEDCYLHDNTRGNLRINGGTEVRNTHVHFTGNNVPTRGYTAAGHYSYYEGSRNIRLRHCQIDMPDSDFPDGGFALRIGQPDRYAHPTMTVENSQVRGDVINPKGLISFDDNSGNNPEIDPPNGVPMTPDEAENGTSSATGPTWEEVSSGTTTTPPSEAVDLGSENQITFSTE